MIKPKTNSISVADLLQFFDCAGVDVALAEEPINRLTEDLDKNFINNSVEKINHIQQNSQYFLKNDKHQKTTKIYQKEEEKQHPNIKVQFKEDELLSADIKEILLHVNNQILTTSEINQAAQDLATHAENLDQLRAIISNFNAYNLNKNAKHCLFEFGNRSSPIMIISEVPSRDNDLSGRFLSGSNGLLLEKIINALGFLVKDLYFAFSVYWRPPGGRDLLEREALSCRPFLIRQIEFINPKIIICLGGPVVKVIMGISTSILKLRGQWQKFALNENTMIEIMPTFDIKHLIKMPSCKKLVWTDFLEAKMKFNQTLK